MEKNRSHLKGAPVCVVFGGDRWREEKACPVGGGWWADWKTLTSSFEHLLLEPPPFLAFDFLSLWSTAITLRTVFPLAEPL